MVFPRLISRGRIEAIIKTPGAMRPARFPRLISRGLIEASPRFDRPGLRARISRLISRGLIEASPDKTTAYPSQTEHFPG